MKRNFRAALSVNNVSIELNPFVEEFIAQTVVGAVSSLKGTDDILSLDIYMEQGDVRIIADGNEIPLTPFPNHIIASTMLGLVSSLKGVGDVASLSISVKAQ